MSMQNSLMGRYRSLQKCSILSVIQTKATIHNDVVVINFQ